MGTKRCFRWTKRCFLGPKRNFHIREGGLKALPPNEDTRVLIAADEDARHKQVLALLDAAKAAKVEKVGFETKAPQP